MTVLCCVYIYILYLATEQWLKTIKPPLNLYSHNKFYWCVTIITIMINLTGYYIPFGNQMAVEHPSFSSMFPLESPFMVRIFPCVLMIFRCPKSSHDFPFQNWILTPSTIEVFHSVEEMGRTRAATPGAFPAATRATRTQTRGRRAGERQVFYWRLMEI